MRVRVHKKKKDKRITKLYKRFRALYKELWALAREKDEYFKFHLPKGIGGMERQLLRYEADYLLSARETTGQTLSSLEKAENEDWWQH